MAQHSGLSAVLILTSFLVVNGMLVEVTSGTGVTPKPTETAAPAKKAPKPSAAQLDASLKHFLSKVYKEEEPDASKCEWLQKGGFGEHGTCKNLLTKSLKSNESYVISYGVQNDWSWETAMGKLGFKVVACDPTVNHPLQLTTNTAFFKVGAPMRKGSMRRTSGDTADTSEDETWPESSPALIAKTMGIDHIGTLKMDCEGCEYAISDSILDCTPGPECDRNFFKKVDQVAVEIHMYTKFIPADLEEEYITAISKLLWLLEEAGLTFIKSSNHRCARPEFSKEDQGCPQKAVDAGLDCEKACLNPSFARLK